MISKRIIFVAVIAFGGMLLSMNDERFSLKKEERIRGGRRTETLFVQGKSFVAYPLRVVYHVTTQDLKVPVSVLISIPKKRIKSAVQRNRMKRLIREAYRLNKHLLNGVLPGDGRHLDIAFIYVKDELTDYVPIEMGMRKAMMELTNQLAVGGGEC